MAVIPSLDIYVPESLLPAYGMR